MKPSRCPGCRNPLPLDIADQIRQGRGRCPSCGVLLKPSGRRPPPGSAVSSSAPDGLPGIFPTDLHTPDTPMPAMFTPEPETAPPSPALTAAPTPQQPAAPAFAAPALAPPPSRPPKDSAIAAPPALAPLPSRQPTGRTFPPVPAPLPPQQPAGAAPLAAPVPRHPTASLPVASPPGSPASVTPTHLTSMPKRTTRLRSKVIAAVGGALITVSVAVALDKGGLLKRRPTTDVSAKAPPSAVASVTPTAPKAAPAAAPSPGAAPTPASTGEPTAAANTAPAPAGVPGTATAAPLPLSAVELLATGDSTPSGATPEPASSSDPPADPPATPSPATPPPEPATPSEAAEIKPAPAAKSVRRSSRRQRAEPRKASKRKQKRTSTRRLARTLAAVESRSTDGDAREAYARGNARLLSGDLDGAIGSYQDAIRLDPKEPAGYRGLGLAYAEKGDTADAIRNLRRYLKIAPRAPDRHLVGKRLRLLGSAPTTSGRSSPAR